jgi:Ca2+-binding EF-hand superfamily protein
MIKTLMTVAVAGVFALPVAASAGSDNTVVAQAGGGGGGADATGEAMRSSNFDRLDRNRDGFISRDEAKDAPELQTRFSELDTNNDGKLSREEYDALNSGASGATSSDRTSGDGGGDAGTSGANTK